MMDREKNMESLQRKEAVASEAAPDNNTPDKRGRMPRATVKTAQVASRKGHRYSREARKTLLAKYEHLRAAGQTALKAARQISVSYITLRKWQTAEGSEPAPRGRPPRRAGGVSARRLAAPRAAALSGLVLITPAGFRIEGLGAEEIVRVLREMR